jgi:hypothetical protein
MRPHIAHAPLHAPCHMLHATCYTLLHATCHMLPWPRNAVFLNYPQFQRHISPTASHSAGYLVKPDIAFPEVPQQAASCFGRRGDRCTRALSVQKGKEECKFVHSNLSERRSRNHLRLQRPEAGTTEMCNVPREASTQHHQMRRRHALGWKNTSPVHSQ